ncbi:NAD(P)-binding protein [Phanerochaete sordida]|uniref:NAD(P)-binding protein n=1 Tax=Phanerochaete sordida TaxID=48140 RepID=A0A9P3LKJ9_9APHY|nr:NAD(P)-binding protein [Phanerochaete sordida]
MGSTPPDSRVWLITGAASGVGRATAELVLSRGERVLACVRRPTDLAELAYPPTHLRTALVDVTRPPDIAAAFAQAHAAFGRVDVVLNSAALALFGEAEGTPDAAARAVFEVNFWGAANVAREAVRFFREENPPGSGGRLMTVSSYAGLVPLGGCAYYSAAKAALEAVHQALAGELDPQWHIQVSIVVLGTVRTPMAAKATTLPAHPAYTAPGTPAALGRTIIAAARDPAAKHGDLARTVARIYDLAGLERPPLRLVLGLDSLGVVRGHLGSVLREVEEYEGWSEGLREE